MSIEDIPVVVVKVTYELRCPKCGTGYTPEQDPCGCSYQCEVCEEIFMPVDEGDFRSKFSVTYEPKP